MYCRKCGNNIQGNEKFCGKCGASLDNNSNSNIIENNSSNSFNNQNIPPVLFFIAYVIGIFSSGILGLIKFGVDFYHSMPFWLPLILFIIGLIIAIYTKICYKNYHHSTLILILYIVFGLINVLIYYFIIFGIYEFLRNIFV